ncbi:hypothetical protein CMU19_04335 [Elizabethkingia anophelis]|nr:hypothetical protein [Elizabethkingia anophelis]
MEQIEFRGKVTKDFCNNFFKQKWVYGSVLYCPDEIVSLLYGDDASWETETDTIGQFTGLLDKKGNKIFEGDILNVPERVYQKDGKLIKSDNAVYFENGMFKCNNLSLCTYMNHLDLEVIGNIHDNKDLL